MAQIIYPNTQNGPVIVKDKNLSKYKITSGSYSFAAVVTNVFTVSIPDQQSANYSVSITPTTLLSAAQFYVTNKTISSFDVFYTAGLTGTVTFDWIISK